MPIIKSATYHEKISNWRINLTDQGRTGRNHENHNKLNLDKTKRICQHKGCTNKIHVTRTSGLCDIHSNHAHDILLELEAPGSIHVTIPAHTDIIDQLINWAQTRNYNLSPLFSAFSFNLLGNIPDVSTLAKEIKHPGFSVPTLQSLLDKTVSIVNDFFPVNNNSSYQPLITKKGEIPARVLALTFGCLVLCEETNRGDRWFWREIGKAEYRTQFLGGAMPIAYYAAMSFSWGVELGRASINLTPRL